LKRQASAKLDRSVASRFPPGLVSRLGALLAPDARDESAVPSYSHWNPAIRWLMFRRLDMISEMTLGVLEGRRAGVSRAVLDFGCGLGMLIPVLAPKLETFYACDEQLGPARLTAEHFGLRNVVWVEPGDLARAVPDSGLDAIVAADVLEHVEDLGATVDLLGQKLRQGGALIVSGPTENAAYRCGRWIAGFSGAYHVRSIFDVEDTIRRSGFVLDRVRRLPFPVPPILFRVTLWRPRG
jgi:2-polyprenyl-3-methyl-5-hydroxy-6-metoxy-1,4-benzoquinol methylase